MSLSVSSVSSDLRRSQFQYPQYPSFDDAASVSSASGANDLAKVLAPLLATIMSMVDKLLTDAIRQAMQAQQAAGGGSGAPGGQAGGPGGGATGAGHAPQAHGAHHGNQGHPVHHGHQGHDAGVPSSAGAVKPGSTHDGAGAHVGSAPNVGSSPHAGSTPNAGSAPHVGSTPNVGSAGHAAGGSTPQTDVASHAAGRPSAVALPPMTGEQIVNEPIVVKAGQVFDGQGVHFKAGPKLGNGDQSETQKPVFILEPGAQLKNVQVSGADGIHAMGDATLNNVWWRDVGEDAFTMKGPGNVKIEGGGAFNATDKIFQLNHGGSFSLDHFTADTFGKAVRTNGGQDFPIDISVTNSSFTNGKEAVVRTDATQASIYLDNNSIESTKWDVEAPDAAKVVGATQRGWKDYTG